MTPNSSAAFSAAPSAATTSPDTWRLYRLEAQYEFLKLLRLPIFAIPTLTFPALFYALFGLSFGAGRAFAAAPVSVGAYLMITYAAFGVIGAALFGLGVGVATERGQGWMLLKRASPMPPGAWVVAKLVMAVLFATLVVGLLYALGAFVGGVRLPLDAWAGTTVVLVAGAIPFCAMGLALGYLLGPNSAPAVVNLIYMPMAFASGLWIPIQMLPDFVQAIAPALPPYHLAQLALKPLGASVGTSAWIHLAALAGWTAASILVARWAFRRDENRTWG